MDQNTNQNRRTMLALLGGAIALAPLGVRAQGAAPTAPGAPAAAAKPAAATIKLTKARTKGGRTVMEVLARRSSTREFAARALSARHLGELLWAAIGINRPDGHRTAPNWRDMHSIDVYVVMKEGAYLYDPAAHQLTLHREGNFMALTGTQDFVPTAALNLLMIADFTRMGSAAVEAKRISSSADAACIGENVYIYCASEGLGTVLRGNVDRDPLHKALGLRAEQYIAYAQSVGYRR